MRRVIMWFALAFTNIAFANEPYEMKDIVLLQPEFVLQERVSASTLAPYIQSVNATAADVLASRDYKSAGGFLVVAIRPGNQSAVWLDIEPVLPSELSAALIARLRAIPVPTVGGGPVVFAVRVSLRGGAPPTKSMPSPQAWKREAEAVGRPVEVGDLVQRIWPR